MRRNAPFQRSPLTSHALSRAERGSRPVPKSDDLSVQVESLKDQARTTHEEARMVLPGIQALFGFQLIAVFNRPFSDLDMLDRSAYLASLVLVAVAIGLIMAPAAYHRLVERDRVSRHWLRLASRDIAWAMVALTAAIAIDVYLVALMSTGRAALGVALGAAIAALLAWLWFALPLLRRRREHAQREQREHATSSRATDAA